MPMQPVQAGPRRARPALRLQEAGARAFRGGPGRGVDDHAAAGARRRVFLPFNRGHDHGAGNPPVEGNWKTHYLWDEVLQADSLLDILQRFMHLEVKEKQVKTDKGVRTIRKETMIFPRYHQLDAVRQLVAHARAHGVGPQLSDPALGRLGQVELHRLAGAPAGEPARRQRREGVSLGRRRHRPARARSAAAEHDLPVRAQDRASSRRSTRTRSSLPGRCRPGRRSSSRPSRSFPSSRRRSRRWRARARA